jgi:transcriptional regulator with XRE-family HTH domain
MRRLRSHTNVQDQDLIMWQSCATLGFMKNEPADRLEVQIAQVYERPSFTTILELVQAIDDFVAGGGGSKAAATNNESIAVRHRLFQEAFDICFSDYSRNPRRAAEAIRSYLKKVPSSGRKAAAYDAPAVSEAAAESVSPEWIATYHLAVATVLRQRQSASEGRQILHWLMACLDLSYDDLGRMFNVSGETVRRWERGSHPISSERKAEITLAGAALDRLLKMFRLERLSETVRRPAELFERKTALAWILQGRIAEVADRYEILLRYQA